MLKRHKTEHYQVPQDVPLAEALSDAWEVGGTVVHPGGGKECYVRKNSLITPTLATSSENETDYQNKVLAIIVKPFALISIIGSFFIILEVCQQRKSETWCTTGLFAS